MLVVVGIGWMFVAAFGGGKQRIAPATDHERSNDVVPGTGAYPPRRPAYWPENWRYAPAGSPMQGRILVGNRWIDPPLDREAAETLAKQEKQQRSRFWWILLGGLLSGAGVLMVSFLLDPDGEGLWSWSLPIAGVLALYGYLCYRVGMAAQKKGRSKRTWFLLSFASGFVVPATLVAFMREQ